MFVGTNAPQRAVDDLGGPQDGFVFIGNSADNYTQGYYDPLELDTPNHFTLRGLGHNSKIKGDTTHALEINNKSGVPARYYIQHIWLRTPAGNNNAVDALHLNGTHGSDDVFEGWFWNLEIGQSDRHGINMVGGGGANEGIVVSQYFIAPFMEGIDQAAFKGNQHVQEVGVTMADWAAQNDKSGGWLQWDGSDLVAVVPLINTPLPSGTAGIDLQTNAIRNVVVANRDYGVNQPGSNSNLVMLADGHYLNYIKDLAPILTDIVLNSNTNKLWLKDTDALQSPEILIENKEGAYKIQRRNEALWIEDRTGQDDWLFRDGINGVTRLGIKGDGGVEQQQQDLSVLSLGSADHGDRYYHDGTASITLHDATTTSVEGYYVWDNDDSGWRIDTQLE